jgi:hypothetical protein
LKNREILDEDTIVVASCGFGPVPKGCPRLMTDEDFSTLKPGLMGKCHLSLRVKPSSVAAISNPDRDARLDA